MIRHANHVTIAFALVCAVFLAAERRAVAADELPVLAAATVQLDEKQAAGWEAPSKVDDRDVRVLKPGGKASLPVPAWWAKDQLRPAKGSAWRAVVEFKDTATKPIPVLVFAGLPGHFEMHRIGGTGDGQWKTAQVPLPWDMVARIPGKAHTELIFRAPGGKGVPVAKVSIEKGNADADETLWAAETRAWVVKAQAAVRDTLKAPEAQLPVLGETWKDQPLVPFARPMSKVVLPHHTPQEGEAGAALKIESATNEIQPAPFAVFANGKALQQVNVALDAEGLKTADGKVFPGTVELFAAEYALHSRNKPKVYPMRLWPAYAVNVPAGQSHLFWLNIDTAGKTEPGVYSGHVAITAEGLDPVKLPLELKVTPIKLLTLSEAGLHMGGCTTALLPAHEMEFLNHHNHNSINLWYSGVSPGIKKKSATEFELDFTLMDDFMAHARAAGTENFIYFLGGNPYGFPDAFHLERELYRQVHFAGDDFWMPGREEYIKKSGAHAEKGGEAATLLPEIRENYKSWVKQIMQRAQDKNWPEPILTPFDEPAKWTQGNWARATEYCVKDKDGKVITIRCVREKEKAKFMADFQKDGNIIEDWGTGGADVWIKGHFKDACAAIHEAWPKARIYGSIHHAKQGLPFLPDVEVFCTNAIHEDKKLGDKVRAAGPTKTFWQYSGAGAHRSPSEGRYAFGFFFGAYNSRGSLCWAYNWGPRFDTTAGGNSWQYAETTPYSVVRSPYFEGMREAWDDRRYIETLRHVAKEKGEEAVEKAEALLKEIFDVTVASRTGGGRDTVHDFFARSKDPDALDAQRKRIADMIVELQK